MKNITAIFLLMISSLVCFSQKKENIHLSGAVYSDLGELLKNGFLTFKRNRHHVSTVTDSLGNFKVSGLQKGMYKVHFEIMKGYYYVDTTVKVSKNSNIGRLIFRVVK
ncbi:peptidase associated/transthyretin-like domain-containing protein [Flavisolibacter ginsengisoli]|jgi:hypothetical protein|uniref:Cna protein B-type domain-containing protein n=1 Tax=Flavisolibacter ginsengisoli DSM 18119 TaxID=1121884 RepID=A0A1M5DQ86_9BACT|nr:hypothetical protein [Flavisolibacter ginsengisoli]SHF69198.1 Cna protein B-type domain-containing protein [Flavisolibacter ginsengisoli DSM 18119]